MRGATAPPALSGRSLGLPRRKLARLYASAWSWTALARKVVHESRVHLTAFFPSLIHWSAVPRPL